jgi:acyl homoserine lactone synthase
MFFVLTGSEIDNYPSLRSQMFSLRSRVFRDELSWVDHDGDEERDIYDSFNPVYVLHTDETGRELYACGRLMPTNGPTLLADVFGDTVPDADFASPFVWEITRLCVDDDLIRARGLCRNRIAILRSMHVAALEYGIANGVETFLANFDDLRLRMWRRFGAAFDVIGTSDKFSVRVHLGVTPCSTEALLAQRAALGIEAPLLAAAPTRRVLAEAA